jgi:hypothetical protein
MNRRHFLATAALAPAFGATLPKGKADACILLWLGGGAAHIDTFDPKRKGDGKKVAGSAYNAIDTAVQGVQLCEHLKKTAPLLDRCALIRTLSHDIVSEHGAASNLVHTGRMPSGTIQYPSIGSIVSKELGTKDPAVPSYVVMGYPNITRDPGFLGAKYGYVYLTQTETGPNGFVRPPDVDNPRQDRRETLLAQLSQGFEKQHPDDQIIRAQASISSQGFKMAGPKFMNVFDLAKEPKTVREDYGGEFGQRCLLARRLVQSGVRFVEVSFNLNFLNGSGWDTHNDGQTNQHLLIKDLDQAFAMLLTDLEKNKLLDTTLIVIATEFGRPAEFDSGGGRGHHSKVFSAVLAGGGLKTAQAIGVSDELGMAPIGKSVSVPDFHATIHCALGINPHKNLFAGDRPVPITDQGAPLLELFS